MIEISESVSSRLNSFAGIAVEGSTAVLAGIKVGGEGFAVQRTYVPPHVCNWICAGRAGANDAASRFRAAMLAACAAM